MIGIIIITHGEFGKELLKTTESITGKQNNVWCISIPQVCALEKIKEQFRKIIDSNPSYYWIIMTDMFGGTPSNISLMDCEKRNVEVISGVNLPMLIYLFYNRALLEHHEVGEDKIKNLVNNVIIQSKESMKNIKEIFLKKLKENK